MTTQTTPPDPAFSDGASTSLPTTAPSAGSAPAAPTRAWFDEPLRIVHTVLRHVDAHGYDARAAVDYALRLRGNVLVVNGGGLWAFYPSEVEGHRRVPGLDRDVLADVRRATLEAGLRLVVRIDVRGGHREMFDRHPDWFSVDQDGEPLQLHGLHATTPLSPFRNEGFAFPVVHEILERYDVDGIWENAPLFGPLARGPVVERAFRAATGLELPRAADWGDPAYRAWTEWRYDCVTEHSGRLRDVVKSHGPDKAYVAEGPSVLDPDWLRESGIDYSRVAPHWDVVTAPTFDVLAGSHGSGLWPAPVWKAEETTKFLRAVHPGKVPAVLYGPFDNASRYTSVVRQELRLWLAGILAHGGAFWDCTFVGADDSGFLDRRNQDVIADFHSLSADNPDVYARAVPLADVAVVVSRRAEERFGAGTPGLDGYVQHVRGVELALQEEHVPFDLVPEDRVTPELLEGYRLVVLPRAAFLPAAVQDALRVWVRAGGGLVATGDTSLLDDTGTPRDEFGLADVFGVARTGAVLDLHHAYGLVRERGPLTAGLEETDVVPAGGRLHVVVPRDGATVPVTLVPDIVPQPPELGWRDPAGCEVPLLVTHEVGAGRSTFFPGATDLSFASDGHPDHGTLVKNAMAFAAGPGPRLVQTDAPASVHVSLTRCGDRHVVHLLNYSGGHRRPLTAVQEVRDVRVTLPRLTAGSATTVRGRRSLEVVPSGPGVSFVLPRLEDYEAVVLEG